MKKINPSINVMTEESRLKYLNLLFTEKGFELLDDYSKLLGRIFIEKNPKDFPLKIGLVLGFPLFPHSAVIHSKDELHGRLKVLAQILAVNDIRIIIDEKKYIIELGGKNER